MFRIPPAILLFTVAAAGKQRRWGFMKTKYVTTRRVVNHERHQRQRDGRCSPVCVARKLPELGHRGLEFLEWMFSCETSGGLDLN